MTKLNLKFSNAQIQKELNDFKWQASTEAQVDLSQKMAYCDFCETKCKDNQVPQEVIDTKTLCAKAYRKSRKARK